jgi:hypothetical protein
VERGIRARVPPVENGGVARYALSEVTRESVLPWYPEAVEYRLSQAADELGMAVGDLPDAVVDAVHRGLQRLEKSTEKNYRMGWLQFRDFCRRNGVRALPTTTTVVCAWMSEDLGLRVGAKNMQNYLSAVNKAHVHLELERPAIGERVIGTRKSLLRDQRLLKPAPKRIRFPADVIMNAIELGVNEVTVPDGLLRSVVAVVVDSVCGSRGDTGVHIRPGDVVVSPDGVVVVLLRAEKGSVQTDALTGEERKIIFAAGAVSGLASLVRRWQARVDLNFDVAASGRRSWYALQSERNSLSWDVGKMNDFLTLVLDVLAVVPPEGFSYSYHSIRHMAASSMAAINVHESKMVDMQGWKSKRVALTTYVDPKCPVSAGCYFLFGHLLPPSEAEVRRLIERQPILWQW